MPTLARIFKALGIRPRENTIPGRPNAGVKLESCRARQAPFVKSQCPHSVDSTKPWIGGSSAEAPKHAGPVARRVAGVQSSSSRSP